MGILYDPKRRRPQIWIYFLFVLIPIVIIFLFFKLGGDIAEEDKIKQEIEQEKDIFDKF